MLYVFVWVIVYVVCLWICDVYLCMDTCVICLVSTLWNLRDLCFSVDICVCPYVRCVSFSLCESWDMSLFVCESCVTMCDTFVLWIWICA